ncbi:N-6 DNA methylase [Salinivibrio sp. AR640]|uniref:N-6 DNA methylase n=1 Tax=Salinivibrio sp. AR640 TaxID=1909437 RepID=UPI0009D610F3|nr:N-6 DNA methylase [Salinivibrio sp. AR640]OOE95966.1 hypothetical protein BZG75_01115 [Salinivibrio sp. AR640]
MNKATYKMSSNLSLKELNTILWKVASLFRGRKKPSNVKEQFLRLIFIKRLSDSFEDIEEEQFQLLLRDGYSEDEAEKLSEKLAAFKCGFCIPKTIRWSKINNLESDLEIAHMLNNICYEIEHSTKELEGVLTAIDFIPGNSSINNLLKEAIYYLSDFNLSDNYLTSTDVFPYAFELLIKRFADESGKKAGEFYTPNEVVRLLVGMLKPEKGMSLYDPTCGVGGMLIQAYNSLKEREVKVDSFSLYGQEINLNTWAICKMNVFLHGALNTDVRLGDTLLEPKHLAKESLAKFDMAVANPPYNLKIHETDVFWHDRYQRFCYGVPPKNSADLAFLQHMISSLNEYGQAGMILPSGALSRGHSERNIREGILKDDLVEAVVSLPPGLFYGTSIPTSIIIINKNKERQRKHKVLFIDASQDFFSKRKMNVLREDDIHKIVRSFEEFESVGTFCKVVSIDAILAKDSNLSTTHYVNNSPVIPEIDALLSHHEGFERVPLSNKKLVKSVSIASAVDDLDESNTIYFKRIRPELGAILLSLKGPNAPKGKFIQVRFCKNKLLSEYAKLFFESELGRKMLSQIPTGTSIQSLSTSSIQSLSIPIPKTDVQLEVIKVASKLEIAREQIEEFFKKLTTEPKKYKSIEDSTDEMVFRLSALSDVKHLQHLISLGETRQMEFKQSFFANVDKLRDEAKKVERNSDVQAEIIKVIVSFLNTEGGVLLIGVNDKGKVTGVDIEQKRFGFKKMDNYFQELGAQLASRISADYAQYCQLTEVPFDGKIVVRIDCLPAPAPMFLDNSKFYIRTDTSSPELTGGEMLRYIQSHFKVALLNEL